jgi:N-dimethylarginine dimethylaminohydrolase
MSEVIAKGFGVYDEWGPLKEVIVGRADTAKIPEWDPVYSIVSPELQKVIQENPGRLARDIWPQFIDEFQAQLDFLAGAFEENGVIVYRPRPFTEEEYAHDVHPSARGIAQMCPADCLWVVGRNYIEMAQRLPTNRKNFLWARDQFLPKLEKNDDARWLACPISQPSKVVSSGPGPYLEGGDIILVGNGRDVLCGVDKHSTDERGFRWLSQALAADGYRVWPVTFNMLEVHLLAHLNLIRPGLGIICREAFEGHGTLPEPIRDWEFIEITPEEVHKGGADVVMLNLDKAIVSADQPRLARELADRGIEPQIVNIRRATESSAGVRCCINIVHRQKSL